MSEEFKCVWMDHSMEDSRVTMVSEVMAMAGLQQGECAKLEEKEASGRRVLKRPCRTFKLEHFFPWKYCGSFHFVFFPGSIVFILCYYFFRLSSLKEKNKYRILTHICGTQKNGTDELVRRAEIETQMQRTNVWTPRGEVAGGGGGGVMNWEIGIDMYTLMCIKWMTNKNRLYKKNKIKFKN